jgi:transposase
VAYNFVPCDRGQQFLMPPSVDEWLPRDHLARFVVAVVETLDLSGFFARRRADGWGRAAYDPRMMVALLIYAYAMGVRSSRLVERRCVEDVAFRFIAANECPDHATVARFLKDHAPLLGDLFDQVLRLAAEVGLVRVGLVALDSTKVKANASAGANRGIDWIRAEVGRIIGEAQAADEQDQDAPGAGDVPQDLVEPDSRLSRLLAAKERLEDQQRQRQTEYEALMAARQERKRRGEPVRGRIPYPPDRERAEDQRRSKRANVTDPYSRIMKASNGGFLQGYNAQVIATKDQITIACAVTDDRNDYAQLEPMVQQAQDNIVRAGVAFQLGVVLADSGYLTEDNLASEQELGVELLIATKDHGQAEFQHASRPCGRIPKNLTRTQRMKRKLRTRRGERLYRKRCGMIEPVFGQQRQRGAGRFRRRGQQACNDEWRFEQAVHNLRKIQTSGRWTPPPQP